ncbi:MAG: hypothetical protein JXB47_07695 [Anaerolineae bacterium]|nr:hypothetical protein [Anaerolineae bacterium]
MKKIAGFFIIALAALSIGVAYAAQDLPMPPPAIILFDAQADPVSLQQVEAGATEMMLAWHVINVRPGDRLRLEMYRGRSWVALTEANEVLPAVAARAVTITHPMNFGPPTYRLSIVDAAGAVIDERTVVIPYGARPPENPPEIVSFATRAAGIDATALRGGAAWIPVTWEVINRRPTANLVFEQIHDDGSATSVELPRESYWVASAGEGIVAPFAAAPTDQVVIRLQVVDVITGEVFDTAEITLAVTGNLAGAPVLTATPLPGAATQTGAGPTVVSFTAAPQTVQPGGEVLLQWETRSAQRVWIEQFKADTVGAGFTQYTPADHLYADLPLTGSLKVTLPGDYTGKVATFILVMDTYNVSARGPGARVDVPVVCQGEFFFAGGTGCPAGPVTEVAGAYQAFETGHMLWRSDTGQVYVHYSNGTAAYYSQSDLDAMADNPVADAAPPGQYKPINAFGRVWGNSAEVKVRLGWAVTPEQGYTMQIQTALQAAPAAHDYLTLPDGQIIGTGAGQWEFK